MHDKFYDLQHYLESLDLPETTSLIPSELRDDQITEKLIDIYKAALPEISNTGDLTSLHSFTNLPIECDLNEIEALLSKYEPINSSFFEIGHKEILTDGFVSAGKTDVLNTKSSNLNFGMSTNNKNNANTTTTEENDSNIDQYILDRIKNEILETTNNITWSDIIGLDNVKKIINEIVLWPMQRPDLFTGLRGPPKGLMLFGPPGTGKTMIGKCIASQCKATFFSISASSLTSKWVGEGEKMVRALFYLGRKMQPSVIFIDEIDSLLSQRSENENEGSRRIKTEFLVQFDGTNSSNDDKILVIGATNRPQEIDEAARRRLVKRVYVCLPSIDGRINMVKNLVKDYKNQLTEENLNYIGQLTEGYSGSDMFNLCREASLEPLREIDNLNNFETESTRPIVLEDFVKAVRQIKKSVSDKDLDMYKEWNEIYGSF